MIETALPITLYTADVGPTMLADTAFMNVGTTLLHFH